MSSSLNNVLDFTVINKENLLLVKIFNNGPTQFELWRSQNLGF